MQLHYMPRMHNQYFFTRNEYIGYFRVFRFNLTAYFKEYARWDDINAGDPVVRVSRRIDGQD